MQQSPFSTGKGKTTPVNDGINAGCGLFLPRFGLAWRPVAKTVVRLGFGLGADSSN
jgi:hypothetical protein